MGIRGRGQGGRGSSRGGSRGRGGRGGRGRGRGRGGTRFTSRVSAPVVIDEEEEAEEEEVVADVDEASDVESEEEEPAGVPYLSLLQMLRKKETTSDSKKRSRDPPLSEDQRKKQRTESDSETESQASDRDFVDEEATSDLDADLERDQGEGEDDDDDSSDSDDEDASDPFDAHIQAYDEMEVRRRIDQINHNQYHQQRPSHAPEHTSVLYQSPGIDATAQASAADKNHVPPALNALSQVSLKAKLAERAPSVMPAHFDAAQRETAPYLFHYRDLLYCQRTVQNGPSLRKLVCLHAVNHVLKTNDRIVKNNYKLAKRTAAAASATSTDPPAPPLPDFEPKDQGFTRPKVLFLLPTRNACAQVMDILQSFVQPDQVENRKRFEAAYVREDAKLRDDNPPDFRDLFDGNDDDMFRLGVKLTRKSLKYFSPFYGSDILLASPLGLRMAMGSDDDNSSSSSSGEKKKKTKLDYDFLSSLEMVIVDQADALLMQNWEHVEEIFAHMNRQPREAHGCDFGRVRPWYLEGWAPFFRQTIVLSAFYTPELATLARLHHRNYAGRVRIEPDHAGILEQLPVRPRQIFARFQPPSLDRDADARFEFFAATIVPMLAKAAVGRGGGGKDVAGTLLFIPSYLDFVRVRNYFATSAAVEALSFAAVSEYTPKAEAMRARALFLDGRHRVLLYTERAHHFLRYRLRGVRRVIFYGAPENPTFYREIAGDCLARTEQALLAAGQPSLMTSSSSASGASATSTTVRLLYSKYDVLKLRRIVGNRRAVAMMADRSDTFEFA